MKKLISAILFLFSFYFSQAQFNDLIWELGFKPCVTCFDRKEMRFHKGDPEISIRPGTSNIQGFSAVYINSDSTLFCFSNGHQVFNKNYELMANGEGLNPKGFEVFGNTNGLFPGQMGFFLPHPNEENIIFLIHTDFTTYSAPSPYSYLINPNFRWYYTKIDLLENGGLGKVVSKNNLILESPDISMIAATKHANGRDWWMICADGMQNRYFRVLLDAQGFSPVDTQYIGSKTINVQQTPRSKTFNFQGNKYLDWDSARGFSLFDFDRCTGVLSNEVRVDFEQFANLDTGWGYGYDAEFSRSGRFLYQNTIWTEKFNQYPYLLQYDLESSNIGLSADTLARADTFFLPAPWWGGLIQEQYAGIENAPDGRIYVGGQSPHFHYIKFPERKGSACTFKTRTLNFDTNHKGFPYLPNFRLGPIDGSPCDTLGLDNHPLATFRYDIEDSTAAPYSVTFTDLSYYEPTSWSWDFGGLSVSSDTSPVFTFPGPGVYGVCLTVCNQNSCDTMCREVVLGMTNTVEDGRWTVDRQQFLLYPNPVGDVLHLRPEGLREAGASRYSFALHDVAGQLVFQREMSVSASGVQFSLAHLPKGLYFYEIKSASGAAVQVGKVVRM